MTQLTQQLFGIHADALVLRERRMALIASNMANADTPGYRAQDMDFDKALAAATEQGQVAARPVASAGHMPLPSQSGMDRARVYRSPLQPSRDQNTVDAEMEKAEFARAALEYRASLSFVEGRLRTLMTAITGD